VPDIYNYLDYRQYLKDALEEKRAADPKLSNRKVAQQAGIDPGTFTRVFSGERNISLNIILKIASVLGLGKRETNHLINLVSFNQAKKESEKRARLADLVLRKKVKTIAKPQYDSLQQWYYLVIRELLNFHPFKGDYGELAARLEPSIQPKEAKKAVETLLQTGLIKKRKDGACSLTDKFITAGEEWQSLALQEMRAGAIRLALEALENQSKEERDISSLTLSLSEKGFDKLKGKLKEFRTAMMEIAREDQDVNRVFQVNLQAFPVTKKPKRKKS
jgi:uncharacterized protein (TIGR02147 family)